jgi:hypothetical protein
MSKTGPGITKTAPRIMDKSAEWYRQSFSSLNGGLEYVIDSFPQLYRLTLHSLKGRFSRGELMLILDVNNGLWLTAQHAGQHLSAQVADGISLDELDKKWEIDGSDLNAKVGALTIFESACMEIWTKAFWEAASRENQDIEEYVRAMTS